MHSSDFYNTRAKEALIVLIEEALPEQNDLKEKLRTISNFVTNLEEHDFVTYLHLRASDVKYVVDRTVSRESNNLGLRADLIRLFELKSVSQIRDFICSDMMRNL